MDKLARKTLRDFYFGDMAAQSFEEWLYKDSILEKLFPAEYTELISLDYAKEEDCLKARATVRRIYDTKDQELLFKHKAIETAQGILNSSIPVEGGCAVLSKIHNDGFEFIPIIFVGYDSEFRDETRKNMVDMLAFYSERVKGDCRIFLHNLKNYAEDI